MAPPPWAERLELAIARGRETWLMLDELTCAPPSVQAALLRVVNERRICDLDISKCKMIAAANPSDQAADGVDLSPAMSNRWCHVNWVLDAEQWCAGELSGWGTPDPELSEIRAAVCGWIQHNPAALLQVPEFGEDKNAWPSPRAWSNAIKMFRGASDLIDLLKHSDGMGMVGALVGSASASEFCTWLIANDIPKAADIFSVKAKLPNRGDRALLCVSSIIAYALNHNDQINKCWSIISTMRDDLVTLSTRQFSRALKNANIDFDMTPEALKCHKLAA